MSRSLPQDSDLIGVRCSQAWVFFKISPGDSNVLPELRTNDLKFLPDITHWKVELPGFLGSWGIECLLAILLLSSFVSLAGSIIKQVHWAGIPRVFVDSWVFNTSQLERPGGPGLWERERIGSSLPPTALNPRPLGLSWSVVLWSFGQAEEGGGGKDPWYKLVRET